jgi:hypothetical protein
MQGKQGLFAAVTALQAQFPKGVPDNLNVVIYVHGAPGIFLTGVRSKPGGGTIKEGVGLNDPEGQNTLDDFVGALRPLLQGSNSRLIITGCSIYRNPDGSGETQGRKFVDQLLLRFNRQLTVTIGKTGIQRPSDPSRPTGPMKIEPGGAFVTFDPPRATPK